MTEQSAAPTTGGLPREIFWKTFKDPLTGTAFQALQVKSNAYSVRSREADFAPRYEGVSPLWYGVIISPSGFAAEEATYKRSPRLLFRNREDLLSLIEGMPPPTNLMGQRDLAEACASYSLALQQSEFLRIPKSEAASLALKASWLYRDWADNGYEPAAAQVPALRGIALEKYQQAYEQEDISKLKIGSAGVAYLIAELLRERGEYEESLRWFSRVRSDKSITSEVKRVAEDQMLLCRDQRSKAKERADYQPPARERGKERVVFQLYRDQAAWLKQFVEGCTLGESEILRGTLDALKRCGIDCTGFESEEQLAEWLAARLADKDS